MDGLFFMSFISGFTATNKKPSSAEVRISTRFSQNLTSTYAHRTTYYFIRPKYISMKFSNIPRFTIGAAKCALEWTSISKDISTLVMFRTFSRRAVPSSQIRCHVNVCLCRLYTYTKDAFSKCYWKWRKLWFRFITGHRIEEMKFSAQNVVNWPNYSS